MKLATLPPADLKDGKDRNGRLVVVSRDNKRAVFPEVPAARSLIEAVQNWTRVEHSLKSLYNLLNQNKVGGDFDLALGKCLAPLPHAPGFYDGSAFLSHVYRARKSRGAEMPENIRVVPLMYQGVSDNNIPATEDLEIGDLSFGADFEGEFAVITTDVPRATRASAAGNYVALITMFNDISLRELIKLELPTQFGFLQSKPNSAYAPLVVTPDELGDSWESGRVTLDLVVDFNGKRFGAPNGREMHFSFFDLMAHACRTRPLSAGSIVGSGTVSNEDKEKGFACLTEKRFQEILDTGSAKTSWLKPGDQVRMDVSLSGLSVFGPIHQTARLT